MYLLLVLYLFGYFLENFLLKNKSIRLKNLKCCLDVLMELYVVYWLWFLFYVYLDVYEFEYVILERFVFFK